MYGRVHNVDIYFSGSHRKYYSFFTLNSITKQAAFRQGGEGSAGIDVAFWRNATICCQKKLKQ